MFLLLGNLHETVTDRKKPFGDLFTVSLLSSLPIRLFTFAYDNCTLKSSMGLG